MSLQGWLLVSYLLEWQGLKNARKGSEINRQNQQTKMSDKTNRNYLIYTDGGCWPNDGTGKGGWATIIYNSPEKMTISGAKKKTTNNEMELTAIFKGLSQTPEGSNVIIRSDSRYSIDSCSVWYKKWREKGWKKKGGLEIKNLELIQAIVALAESRKVSWQWVKGHSGNPNNEECDRMASAAAARI